jgi:DNA-binding CsgD family transcriptional regulator
MTTHDDNDNSRPWIERRQLFRRASDFQSVYFQSIFASFEQLGRHVMLLNQSLQVLYRSNQLDSLLASHAVPLKLEPCFSLSNSHNAKQFKVFWEAVRQPQMSTEPQSLSCILLLECDKQTPLLLSCFQLHENEHDIDPNDSKIMAILCDPGSIAHSQWRAFQQMFALTAAELRLCLALADGLSLADYGQKYQVTDNTVRSQLKTIFSKTNTRRQSDLMRLIFLFTRL